MQFKPTLFKSQQYILIYYRFRLKGLIEISLIVLSTLIFSPFYSHGTETQGEKVAVMSRTVPLAAKWKDLEIIILSEVRQRKTNIMISLICGI